MFTDIFYRQLEKMGMKTLSRGLILALFLVLLTVNPGRTSAYAQDNAFSDQELAQRYAPVLVFHPNELFLPQSVDGFIQSARLREQRRFWFDIKILSNVSLSDFFHYREQQYFLDTWYGSENISDSMNYASHRAIYQRMLESTNRDVPVVTYAHVVRDEFSHKTTIQYWFFYYYNDWFNKHEGDWEMCEVILNQQYEPEWVVVSQHHGGTRRSWNTVNVESGTHPVIFVALGSHANYFWGDEIYPNGMDIGNARVEIIDRTGSTDRITPQVYLIPEEKTLEEDPGNQSAWGWIFFGGHWGETATQGDFGGPYGPAYKGEQWEKPYTWGMAQPLDTDTWYANRLRIEISGGSGSIALNASSDDISQQIDAAGEVVLLHRDPSHNEGFTAKIGVNPGQPFRIAVTWPDSANSQVRTYKFDYLPPSPTEEVTLTMPGGEAPALEISGIPGKISPVRMETISVTWDAPDLMWMAGLLPGSEVVKGLGISLLASWLPSFLLLGVLYWVDRYEKEPLSLLATAFLWGAVPATLLAILTRLFLRLPPGLLAGSGADAILPDLIEPLVEEMFKGCVVILIAVRYRREFDNILDGIIYGGVVGIGFAMNANIISYIGSFLTRGFAGFSLLILVEGLLYGLNHAFYSAIFGAGLGYGRLTSVKWRRWAVPLAAFWFAVLIHACHNLAIRYSIGLNMGSVALTLVGVIAVAVLLVYSLRRQRQCLLDELVDEVPQDLYQIVTHPGERFRAQWRTLWHQGFRAWRKSRTLNQLCAEFAFKRMQARIFPQEDKIALEVKSLREEIMALSGSGGANQDEA